MSSLKANALIALVLFSFVVNSFSSSSLLYTGVNEAGADFGVDTNGNGALPGTYGSDYEYPTQFSVRVLNANGSNIFRLPFRWERLQPTLGGSFDSTQFSYLDSNVSYITNTLGAYVLLDPHNYAHYAGQVIGSGVSNAQFQDFWTKLASHYVSNSRVIFGLMNEPEGLTTEAWLSAANAAIVGIRSTGATNLITVPGNGYTGAHSWFDTWYGTSNAQVMLGVVDSGNNYAYEVHQYLDGDYSGTSSSCQSSTIGSSALAQFNGWLSTNNRRGFLGEFAGGDNSVCQAAVNDMLNYMEARSNLWLGWTWWAAGPLWGSYMYTVEPKSDGSNSNQWSWLVPHLRGGIPASSPPPPSSPPPAGYTSSPSTSLPPSSAPGSNLNVYTDSVLSPWSSSYSWAQSSTYNLAYTSNSAYIHSGSDSISWSPTNYEGLYFICGSGSDNCFDSSYYAVSFWLNGGSSGGQVIRTNLYRGSNQIGSYTTVTAVANQWIQVISLISAQNAGAGSFSGFSLQSDSASSLSTLYIDDIQVLTTNPNAVTSSPSNSPVSATSSPRSASNSPISVTSSPRSATSSPRSASPSPKTASNSPISATSSPRSASPSPKTASNSPTSPSASPKTASNSPTSPSNSPRSASNSPISATSSPRSASNSPISATSSPRSASPSPISASASPITGTSTNAQAVYTDSLVNNWFLTWSWSNTYSVSNTASGTVHSGADSLSWNPTSYGGLYFACGGTGTDCFDSTNSALTFWVNGGSTGGHPIQIQARRSSQPVGNVVSFSTVANTWVQMTVPISEFAAGAGVFDGFTLQYFDNPSRGNLYLDDISFN